MGLRKLGLMVVAALAMMVFARVEMASATTLCAVATDKCEGFNQYASGTVVVAESTQSVLTGSLSVQCASKIKVTTTTISGKPIVLTVNELTWSSCEGACPTAVTTTLPKGSIEGTAGTKGQLGTIVLKGMVVKMTGCLGANFTCTVTATEAKLAFNGGAIGSTANAKAANVPVTISGFGCGTEGKWNAGGGSGGNAYIVKSVNGVGTGSIFSSFEP